MNKGTTANPRTDAFGPSAGIVVVMGGAPLKLIIKNLDATSFAPYGKIIENAAPDAALASSGQNEFQVVDSSENSDGWRLATIIVRERRLSRMGYHPNTKAFARL